MDRLLAIVALGSLTSPILRSRMIGQQQPAITVSGQMAEAASTGLPTLPPIPRGRATVIGGEMHNVDPVRDQFTLDVSGGRPIKLLFDARTSSIVTE